MTANEFDVLIVGAGYTALAAATELKKMGRRVAVLEARDRVGGRTLERQIVGGQRLEMGGQYFAPSQERMTRLVHDLGLESYPAWSTGDWYLAEGERVARYQSTPAKCLVEQLGHPSVVREEIEATLAELARLYPEVPAATPWRCANAEAWDAMTFQTWIDGRHLSRPSQDFFQFLTNQAYSTEPGEISLLQMLWFLKTTHGLPAWALGGPQANRVKGGTQLVAERLAERLGDAIHLGQVVRGIEQDAQGVCVRTDDTTYRARAAIVCLPTQLLAGLRYDPPLPSDLYRALVALQTGNSMKVQAVYERPFWRERGWSGNGINWEGPQTFTFDNSPQVDSPQANGSQGSGPGVLLGFFSARRATDWNRRPAEERKTAVLQAWASVFGEEALTPLEYIEMDWAAEPFTRGGHGCHFPPGTWCELGPALGGEQMPRFNRVWWAASDLAKDWNGYLEGAIHAGEQAAAEVSSMLGHDLIEVRETNFEAIPCPL